METMSLKVNVNKAKIVGFEGRGGKTVWNFALDEERIEQFYNYLYFGNLLTTDGKMK